MSPAKTFAVENVARARAVALITSFCQATDSDEELDEECGEEFFDIIEEIVEDPNQKAVEQTIIALMSFMSGMLDHLDIDCDRFDIISGLAHIVYGGII